jgi:hypothetical protein
MDGRGIKRRSVQVLQSTITQSQITKRFRERRRPGS